MLRADSRFSHEFKVPCVFKSPARESLCMHLKLDLILDSSNSSFPYPRESHIPAHFWFFGAIDSRISNSKHFGTKSLRIFAQFEYPAFWNLQDFEIQILRIPERITYSQITKSIHYDQAVADCSVHFESRTRTVWYISTIRAHFEFSSLQGFGLPRIIES